MLAIDEDDVTRVAQDHLAPERLLTVIVGDRDKVGPTLEGLNLGEVSEVAIA